MIRTIGACKHLAEGEYMGNSGYRLLEENMDGCNVAIGTYELLDGDNNDDQNNAENNSENNSDDRGSADENEDEQTEGSDDESGCEQSQPRHLGLFYLLLLPALFRQSRQAI